jgi:hypothetical protein
MPLLKVGENLQPAKGQPLILSEKSKNFGQHSRRLTKICFGGVPNPKYHQNFFLEVDVRQGEYLYVGGRIIYQGALMTVGMEF